MVTCVEGFFDEVTLTSLATPLPRVIQPTNQPTMNHVQPQFEDTVLLLSFHRDHLDFTVNPASRT